MRIFKTKIDPLSLYPVWMWLMILAGLLLPFLNGCTTREFVVAKPGDYGYIADEAKGVNVLWPIGNGKFELHKGTLPPGTVVLVPKDNGPTTRP